MKMLLTIAFMSAPAMLCCVTSLHAFVNPCIDLDEEAQEACVAQYTKDRGSSATEAVASEDRSDSTDLVQAVLDDYRSLKTWKERLDLIRTLKTDAQNALDSGEWDGAPNWRYPLKPGVTIMDGDLSRDAMDAATYEGLAALDVVLCNRNGDYTYTEDVYISSGSCTWQGGTVDITGRLIVNTGATLNVVTTTYYNEAVTVTGVAGDSYAIQISGTMYLYSVYNSRYVQLYVGAGKKIGLYNHGYLRAETNTNSTATGRIYFWGESFSDWNGIEALNLGAQIRLYGGTATNNHIYVYNLGSNTTAIKHIGGSSTYNGKLVVRGTYFIAWGTNQVGVFLYCGSSSTLNYFNDVIRLDWNIFKGYYNPIVIGYCAVNQSINIEDNILDDFNDASSTYESQGIRVYYASTLEETFIASNVITDYGEIDDPTTATGYAVWLHRTSYGSNYSLFIYNNEISNGPYGIYAYRTIPASDDVGCNNYYNNNDISTVYTSIDVGEYPSHQYKCKDQDEYMINGNAIYKWGSTYSSDPTRNIGIKVYGKSNGDYPEHEIGGNTITGMIYAVDIDGYCSDFHVYGNTLSFGAAPGASYPILVYNRGANTEIDTNTFGSNGGDARKRHIYSTGSGTTCHDNTFDLSGGGSYQVSGVGCAANTYIY